MTDDDLAPVYEAAGKEWNVDPRLLRAIRAQETGGQSNPDTTVSRAGARGRMGLMPPTAKELGVEDTSDPAQNIYGAAKYLSQMLDKYKTPELALQAYNAGPGRLDAALAGGPALAPESMAYPGAVTKRFLALTQPTARQSSGSIVDNVHQHLQNGGVDIPHPMQLAAAPDPFTDAQSAPEVDHFNEAQAPDPFTAAQGAGQPTQQAAADWAIAGGVDIQHPLLQRRLATGGQGSALGRVADAAIGAVGNALTGPVVSTAPLGMSPDQTAALRQSGIIEPAPGQGTLLQRANETGVNALAPVVDAAGRVIGMVARGANALYSGAQAAVAQAGAEVGQPQLGRDMAAMPDAFMGSPGTLVGRVPENRLTATAPAEANRLGVAPRAQITVEAPAPAAAPAMQVPVAANDMAPIPAGTAIVRPGETVAPSAVGPSEPVPQPAPAVAAPATPEPTQAQAGAPQFQSMGAAASRDLSDPGAIAMTPAEEAAYRGTAEGDKLIERQPVGPDNRMLVPGTEPSLAETTQDARIAREQAALQANNADVSALQKTLESNNQEALKAHYQKLSQSPVDLQNAQAAASAQAESDLRLAFGKKKPTDATPVAETINSILSSPRGLENTQLRAYVAPLLDRLYNADGSMKLDPEQLYGLREDVARMMSKSSKAQDSNLNHVTGELNQIKDSLDGVIEAGAPGYKQYLSNYATAMRKIDTMEALQGQESRLFANGNLTTQRMNTFMRQLVDSRKAPGLNPYKSIPDDTMQGLWDMRDHLRRKSAADNLAIGVPGTSGTAQLLGDIARGTGKLAARGVAHYAVNHVGGIAGNIALGTGETMANAFLAGKRAGREVSRGNALLRPPTNRLLDSGQH